MRTGRRCTGLRVEPVTNPSWTASSLCETRYELMPKTTFLDDGQPVVRREMVTHHRGRKRASERLSSNAWLPLARMPRPGGRWSALYTYRRPALSWRGARACDRIGDRHTESARRIAFSCDDRHDMHSANIRSSVQVQAVIAAVEDVRLYPSTS